MRKPAWEADFAEFFAVAALPLRRTAWGICGDWDQAEDVVQTAFVRIYAKFPTIRDENPMAYARRTVVNLCLSRRRRGWREVLTHQVPDTVRVDAPESAVDVVALLRGLPAQQRAVVTLRFIEDLSVREVADIVNVTEGTVKSQTSRALNTLRAAIGNDIELNDIRHRVGEQR